MTGVPGTGPTTSSMRAPDKDLGEKLRVHTKIDKLIHKLRGRPLNTLQAGPQAGVRYTHPMAPVPVAPKAEQPAGAESNGTMGEYGGLVFRKAEHD